VNHQILDQADRHDGVSHLPDTVSRIGDRANVQRGFDQRRQRHHFNLSSLKRGFQGGGFGRVHRFLLVLTVAFALDSVTDIIDFSPILINVCRAAHLPGTSYGLLRFAYSVVPDIAVHQVLAARFKIPDAPDHAAVILMTDDKAKMGPLVIFNRHILILRCDNLSLLAGKRAIRQGFKRGQNVMVHVFLLFCPA
jgi:hypothetical protein